MDDRELSNAAYYGMILRNRGYSPERAAQAVVKSYPELRGQLERQGLLRPLKGTPARWTTPGLTQLLEGDHEQ